MAKKFADATATHQIKFIAFEVTEQKRQSGIGGATGSAHQSAADWLEFFNGKVECFEESLEMQRFRVFIERFFI